MAPPLLALGNTMTGRTEEDMLPTAKAISNMQRFYETLTNPRKIHPAKDHADLGYNDKRKGPNQGFWRCGEGDSIVKFQEPGNAKADVLTVPTMEQYDTMLRAAFKGLGRAASIDDIVEYLRNGKERYLIHKQFVVLCFPESIGIVDEAVKKAAARQQGAQQNAPPASIPMAATTSTHQQQQRQQRQNADGSHQGQDDENLLRLEQMPQLRPAPLLNGRPLLVGVHAQNPIDQQARHYDDRYPSHHSGADSWARGENSVLREWKQKEEDRQERVRKEDLERQERLRKEDLERQQKEQERQERVRKEEQERQERVRKEDLERQERIRKEDLERQQKEQERRRKEDCLLHEQLGAAKAQVAMMQAAEQKRQQNADGDDAVATKGFIREQLIQQDSRFEKSTKKTVEHSVHTAIKNQDGRQNYQANEPIPSSLFTNTGWNSPSAQEFASAPKRTVRFTTQATTTPCTMEQSGPTTKSTPLPDNQPNFGSTRSNCRGSTPHAGASSRNSPFPNNQGRAGGATPHSATASRNPPFPNNQGLAGGGTLQGGTARTAQATKSARWSEGSDGVEELTDLRSNGGHSGATVPPPRTGGTTPTVPPPPAAATTTTTTPINTDWQRQLNMDVDSPIESTSTRKKASTISDESTKPESATSLKTSKRESATSPKRDNSFHDSNVTSPTSNVTKTTSGGGVTANRVHAASSTQLQASTGSAVDVEHPASSPVLLKQLYQRIQVHKNKGGYLNAVFTTLELIGTNPNSVINLDSDDEDEGDDDSPAAIGTQCRVVEITFAAGDWNDKLEFCECKANDQVLQFKGFAVRARAPVPNLINSTQYELSFEAHGPTMPTQRKDIEMGLQLFVTAQKFNVKDNLTVKGDYELPKIGIAELEDISRILNEATEHAPVHRSSLRDSVILVNDNGQDHALFILTKFLRFADDFFEDFEAKSEPKTTRDLLCPFLLGMKWNIQFELPYQDGNSITFVLATVDPWLAEDVFAKVVQALTTLPTDANLSIIVRANQPECLLPLNCDKLVDLSATDKKFQFNYFAIGATLMDTLESIKGTVTFDGKNCTFFRAQVPDEEWVGNITDALKGLVSDHSKEDFDGEPFREELRRIQRHIDLNVGGHNAMTAISHLLVASWNEFEGQENRHVNRSITLAVGKVWNNLQMQSKAQDCVSCRRKIVGGHKCVDCDRQVHALDSCSKSIGGGDDENTTQKRLCNSCFKKRETARSEEMLKPAPGKAPSKPDVEASEREKAPSIVEAPPVEGESVTSQEFHSCPKLERENKVPKGPVLLRTKKDRNCHDFRRGRIDAIRGGWLDITCGSQKYLNCRNETGCLRIVVDLKQKRWDDKEEEAKQKAEGQED